MSDYNSIIIFRPSTEIRLNLIIFEIGFLLSSRMKYSVD